MSEWTRDAKHERDYERGEPDDRVDETHVACTLDEEAAGERTDRVR
jgi:hypothetical protein